MNNKVAWPFKDRNIIETQVSVLTWNLWWRYGPLEQRREAIITTLKDIDADVIGLQEIWSDEMTNFAAELAEELGYHYVFSSTRDIDSFGCGNALLSRWPISQNEAIMLYGQKEDNEGRGVIFAQINGPRGLIPAFCTHLNWKFQHSHIRQRQVVELAEFVDRNSSLGFPPIVCGDFNAEPTSDEMRILMGLSKCSVEDLFFHDAWSVAGIGTGMTWDNTNPCAAIELEPDRRIDYILVGWPQKHGAGHIMNCRLACNKPVNDVWPSDHYAVLANLRY